MSQSRIKPIVWKRFIDHVFSLWNIDKQEIHLFLEQANSFHPAINLQLKFQSRKSHSLIQLFIQENNSKKTLSLTLKFAIDRLKHFSTDITPPVTHQVSKEVYQRRTYYTSTNKFLGKNFQESLSNFKTRLLAHGDPKTLVETKNII